MNNRAVLNNIKKRWDSPNKLLEYLIELDKQQEQEIEIAYKRGLKETAKNYSKMFVYVLKCSGFGKKTIPKFLDNINIVAKQMETGKLTMEYIDETIKKMGINIQ